MAPFYYVYFNPQAGAYLGLTVEAIEILLNQYQLTYQWLSDESGIQTLLKRRIEENNRNHILVIGGDGTLNRLINTIGVFNLHRFAFTLVPTGSGNDFARSLEIPLILEETLRRIACGQGTRCYVDLGVINHRLVFTCAFSLGFGAQVTQTATRPLKWLLGKGALYWGVLHGILKSQQLYGVKIKFDELSWKVILTPQLVVGNASTHGGGFPISPTASLQSGFLDCYYFLPTPFRELPKLLYQIWVSKNPIHAEKTCYQQVREIKLIVNTPVKADVDGDIYTFYKNIHIQVYPKVLQVWVPQAQKVLNRHFVDNLAG